MLLPVLQMIEETLDYSKFGEKKSKELQDYLSGVLQVILAKIG
jgi:hypothetical protein